MNKYFDKPKQVKFEDEEGNLCYGIAYHDEIICACCGGILDPEEVKIIKVYNDWCGFASWIGE